MFKIQCLVHARTVISRFDLRASELALIDFQPTGARGPCSSIVVSRLNAHLPCMRRLFDAVAFLSARVDLSADFSTPPPSGWLRANELSGRRLIAVRSISPPAAQSELSAADR
jgi:hypothetical protein